MIDQELLKRAERLAKMAAVSRPETLDRRFSFKIDPDERRVIVWQRTDDGSWAVLGQMKLDPGSEELQAAAALLMFRLLDKTERPKFFKRDFKERVLKEIQAIYWNGGRRPKS